MTDRKWPDDPAQSEDEKKHDTKQRSTRSEGQSIQRATHGFQFRSGSVEIDVEIALVVSGGGAGPSHIRAIATSPTITVRGGRAIVGGHQGRGLATTNRMGGVGRVGRSL